MRSLDDPGTFEVDSAGCLAALADAPAAFDLAWERAENAEIPFPAYAADDVVIAGVGGSAAVARLIVDTFWDRLRKPVRVVRGYGLPGWAGERTLVVGATLSGETEETLTCVADAVDRTCPAVGISLGGKMTGFYAPGGVPVIVPPPEPISRLAGAQMLAAMLVVLSRFGVLESLERDLDEGRERIAAAVHRYGADAPTSENPAKQLAGDLAGTLPLIWGAQMTAGHAERWAAQISANARIPTMTVDVPDHNHHLIEGVGGLAEMTPRPHAVILRDPRHHRQVQRRFDAMRTLIEPLVGGVSTVHAEGLTDLARLADLMLLGDFVSLYLACGHGVDPAHDPMAERMTEVLANTGYGRTAAHAPPAG